MCKQRGILFLTLVAVLTTSALQTVSLPRGFASPTGSAPVFSPDDPLPSDPPLSSQPDERDLIIEDTIDIATPPAPALRPSSAERKFIYGYKNILTLRVGAIGRAKSPTATQNPYLAGLQFLLTTKEKLQLEVGVDTLTDGTGILHFARRWTYSTDEVRPFVKLGGGLIVDPKNQIGAFLKHELLLAEGSLGVEAHLWGSSSVRIEIEAGIGLETQQALMAVGYNWAW